jgi:hypothetical protein
MKKANVNKSKNKLKNKLKSKKICFINIKKDIKQKKRKRSNKKNK